MYIMIIYCSVYYNLDFFYNKDGQCLGELIVFLYSHTTITIKTLVTPGVSVCVFPYSKQ